MIIYITPNKIIQNKILVIKLEGPNLFNLFQESLGMFTDANTLIRGFV